MAMPSTQSPRKRPAVRDGGKPVLALAHPVSWLLKTLCDPTRMKILLALTEGKRGRSEICERVGLTEPELNHHLALLGSTKALDAHFHGGETIYSLTEAGAQLVDSTLSLINQEETSPKEILGSSRWKELVEKVGTVVDDPEYWLMMPNPQFEWRRPIDLIDTEDETRVHIIIEAAQAGSFA